MFRALYPTHDRVVRTEEIERSNNENSKREWMNGYGIRLECRFAYRFWNFFATVMRSGHIHHLPTVIFHHAATGTIFNGHLRIWSHARHRRGHAGDQHQQNRSELPHKPHC